MKKQLIITSSIVFLLVIILLFYLMLKDNNKIDESIQEISEENASTIDLIDFNNYESNIIELKESITITNEGIYYISGSLSNGSITINTSGAVKLILDNVSISNLMGPAIFVENAEVVYIELNNTNNIKANVNEEFDGAIYSKDDLILLGDGTLNVESNIDGIVSNDDLVIQSGTYNINTKDDGIKGKDSITVLNGTFNIDALGDGIKTTNEDDGMGTIYIENIILNINSYLDAISSTGSITILNGDFKVISGKNNNSTTDSTKGVKSASNILIKGGNFNITSVDDALHSNSSIEINNGVFNIQSNDDGIHADFALTINDGTFTISAHEGLEATLIKINNGTININASDDGINAAKKTDGYTPTVEINGGILTIVMAQGDTDGIDSNGDIYINGGTITIDGNSAFDYDGQAKYNGGKMIINGEETTTITNQFVGGMPGRNQKKR